MGRLSGLDSHSRRHLDRVCPFLNSPFVETMVSCGGPARARRNYQTLIPAVPIFNL
jgi:hypothetical protein